MIYIIYIHQCYIVPTWHEAVSSERLQAATEYRRDVTERKVAAALGDSVAAAKLGRRDFPVFSSPENLSNSYNNSQTFGILLAYYWHTIGILLAYYWHTGMPKYDLEETPIYEIYMFKK